MKTLEQIREEQRQLEEARELDEYVREAGKILKKIAIGLGITTVELTKSIAKTVPKNPKSSLLAAPFIASFALFPGVVFTAFKNSFATLMVPIVSQWKAFGAGTVVTPAIKTASISLVDGMGIGIITMGAMMVVLYGQKVGTKINKALMKAKYGIKFSKKANKKQAKALVKLATA